MQNICDLLDHAGSCFDETVKIIEEAFRLSVVPVDKNGEKSFYVSSCTESLTLAKVTVQYYDGGALSVCLESYVRNQLVSRIWIYRGTIQLEDVKNTILLGPEEAEKKVQEWGEFVTQLALQNYALLKGTAEAFLKKEKTFADLRDCVK